MSVYVANDSVQRTVVGHDMGNAGAGPSVIPMRGESSTRAVSTQYINPTRAACRRGQSSWLESSVRPTQVIVSPPLCCILPATAIHCENVLLPGGLVDSALDGALASVRSNQLYPALITSQLSRKPAIHQWMSTCCATQHCSGSAGQQAVKHSFRKHLSLFRSAFVAPEVVCPLGAKDKHTSAMDGLATSLVIP